MCLQGVIAVHSTEIRNSNLEILNNIEIQNSNVPNVFGIYDFENWDLFRISNLGFRVSALCAVVTCLLKNEPTSF